MPSKLTGMLASGRPVVATTDPDTEVGRVVDQVGILVPPEDVAALAQALRQLAQDPARRQELGQAGRAWVVENWSKEKVLQRFFQKLSSIKMTR